MDDTQLIWLPTDAEKVEEAEQLGIINRVVPKDKLEEETQVMASKLSLGIPKRCD